MIDESRFEKTRSKKGDGIKKCHKDMKLLDNNASFYMFSIFFEELLNSIQLLNGVNRTILPIVCQRYCNLYLCKVN